MNNKCFILDIDGTLVYHHGGLDSIERCDPILLPGIIDKLIKWKQRGDFLSLISARPETMLDLTKEHLKKLGIIYDKLTLGYPNYPRYLINDSKPYCNMDETAFSYTVKRDTGNLSKLDI